MAKAFSVASWNIEHFGARSGNEPQEKSIKRQIQFLKNQEADIVALYEVRSSIVFRPLVEGNGQLPIPYHGRTSNTRDSSWHQKRLFGLRDTEVEVQVRSHHFKTGGSSSRFGWIKNIIQFFFSISKARPIRKVSDFEMICLSEPYAFAEFWTRLQAARVRRIIYLLVISIQWA